MAKKAKKTKGAVKANFGHKDAKGGGGRARVPEGDYVVEVKKLEPKRSQGGKQMILATYEITEPEKYAGKTLRDNIMLEPPKALFILRHFLESMGKKVPDKTVTLTLSKYLGEEVGVSVSDGEPYEGKVSSEVNDYIDPDVARGQDVDDDDEDEDEEEEDLDLDEDEDDEDEDDEDDEDDEEEDEDDLDEDL